MQGDTQHPPYYMERDTCTSTKTLLPRSSTEGMDDVALPMTRQGHTKICTDDTQIYARTNTRTWYRHAGLCTFNWTCCFFTHIATIRSRTSTHHSYTHRGQVRDNRLPLPALSPPHPPLFPHLRASRIEDWLDELRGRAYSQNTNVLALKREQSKTSRSSSVATEEIYAPRHMDT